MLVQSTSIVLAAWGEDMAQVVQILSDEEEIVNTGCFSQAPVVWFCIFANYRKLFMALLLCFESVMYIAEPGGSIADGGDGCGPSIKEQLDTMNPFGVTSHLS